MGDRCMHGPMCQWCKPTGPGKVLDDRKLIERDQVVLYLRREAERWADNADRENRAERSSQAVYRMCSAKESVLRSVAMAIEQGNHYCLIR